MEPVNERQSLDATETESADADTEHEGVISWRLSQILSLGIGQVDALLLAETGADLGLLRRLIGSGCPPPLAVRIAL